MYKKILLIFSIFILCSNFVYAVMNEELSKALNNYVFTLNKKVKQNWNPPVKQNSYNVIVLVKIKKDGAVESTSIYKSSGDENIDKIAIETVIKSTPFEPLPEIFRRSLYRICNSYNGAHLFRRHVTHCVK